MLVLFLLCFPFAGKADMFPFGGGSGQDFKIRIIFDDHEQQIDSILPVLNINGKEIVYCKDSTFVDSLGNMASFHQNRSDEVTFSAWHWGHLPDSMRIIIYSKGEQIISPWINSYGNDNRYLHISGSGSATLTSIPEKYLWQQWLICFIITLLIELAVCSAWFYSEEYFRKAFAGVLLINCITHPLLFFIAAYLNTNSFFANIPVRFWGEISVFVVEAVFLMFFIKKISSGKAFLFSLAANSASLIIGGMLSWVLDI